ncbi:MAG: hypothetical protein IJ565_05015 [Bacilli bacterium]|nr:hypothetical protein [Bacilli bacterium]
MDESILNKIKENVKNKKEEMSKLKKIKNLQKDENVLEYLKLRGIDPIVTGDIKTTPTIIYETAKDTISHANITHYDTSRIYVYMYSDSKKGTTKYNNKSETGRVYKNIECNSTAFIDKDKIPAFERSNTVIYPEAIIKYGKEPLKVYKEIQKAFFTKAVRTNQQEAKHLIISLYNKK